MKAYYKIQTKIDKFIKRYYFSALIKGVLLFFGFGALYALFWALIEHWFWLPTNARGLVFWCLLAFEAFLLYKLIISPLLKYLKIRKGIDYHKAAVLIGAAFPEINDKLLNAVQLQEQKKTELLLASIDQKELQLNPFSFEKAVSLNENLRYFKYAIAPLIILLPFYLFGFEQTIKGGFWRVVDYKTIYDPPAPFKFQLSNKPLQTIAGEPYTFEVSTIGRTAPDNVKIKISNEEHLLKINDEGTFFYELSRPEKDLEVYFFSDKVKSKSYVLNVFPPPIITSANLIVTPPSYTGLEAKSTANLGYVKVPEGSRLTWGLETTSVDNVSFFDGKKKDVFTKKGDNFFFTKTLFSEASVVISTSNQWLNSHENLELSIAVKMDKPPTIEIESNKVKTPLDQIYFYGQVADDYGVSKIQMKYYPINSKDQIKTIHIPIEDAKKSTFSYAFPNSIKMTPDTTYELYFEALDNYPFPSPHATRTKVFIYNKKSKKTLISQQMQQQQEAIIELDEALKKIDFEKAYFDEFRKQQTQSQNLTFNQAESLTKALSRQSKQDQIIMRVNTKMQESINQLSPDAEDFQRENLQKRLDEQRDLIEENEKLREELKNAIQKLDNLELMKRLDKINKNSKEYKRSLKQMLELTQRYYIKQKTKQIQQKLLELADRQDTLSTQRGDKNSFARQDKANQVFEGLVNEIESLSKKNKSLSRPVQIPNNNNQINSIKKNQEEAISFLKQKDAQSEKKTRTFLNNKAQKEQKKIAQKLRQMAKQMGDQIAAGSQQELLEDATALRQILDNLLLFSFEQENLMRWFSVNGQQNQEFSRRLIEQKSIRTHFEHIDDSLLVVSLRQPLLSSKITRGISEVYHNIDRALELLSEAQIYQATSRQQYALTSANSLADLVSNILDSIEIEINPGKGDGEMQLPDIIMTQEELMKEAESSQQSSGQDSPATSLEGKSKGEKEGGDKGNSQTKGMPGDKAGNGRSDQESFFDSEESSLALMQLYKKQEQLRESLERLLRKTGISPEGREAVDAMRKIEETIITQGVQSGLIDQMRKLGYRLLKLEESLNDQGIENQRESTTSKEELFENSKTQYDSLRIKLNSRDELKRDDLPLQKDYLERVIEYFKLKYD